MGRAPTDTRQKLIDAALELLWKSSYGAVSVDDICAAAQVKKGSFYYFFASKSALVVAAMQDNADRSTPNYDAIFSAAIAPLQRITRFAQYIIATQEAAKEKYGHFCGCPYATVGSEMAMQEPDIRDKFLEISKTRIRYFESAVRDLMAEQALPANTDVAAKAQELYAYVSGQLTLARIQDNLAPLKDNLAGGMVQLLGVAQATQSQP